MTKLTGWLALLAAVVPLKVVASQTWPQGNIWIQPSASAQACADAEQLALKRADLAYQRGDQDSWAQNMALAIRGGCQGEQIDQRLQTATQGDTQAAARADAAMLAAVQRDRPEVFTATRSVGKPLNPTRSNSGWMAAVEGLTGLMAARQSYLAEKNGKPTQVPVTRDAMTQRVYDDIFAESSTSAVDPVDSTSSLQQTIEALASLAQTTEPPATQDTVAPEPVHPGFSGDGSTATEYEPASRTPSTGGQGNSMSSTSTASGPDADTPASWQEQVQQLDAESNSTDEFDMGDLDDF